MLRKFKQYLLDNDLPAGHVPSSNELIPDVTNDPDDADALVELTMRRRVVWSEVAEHYFNENIPGLSMPNACAVSESCGNFGTHANLWQNFTSSYTTTVEGSTKRVTAYQCHQMHPFYRSPVEL